MRSVAELATAESGRRVHVGGLVTHRQRPGTAMGVTFLNLEDETGMLNVVCSVGVMKAHRHAARNRVAVVIRGRLERNEGVTNLVADRVEPIDVVVPGAGAVLQARASSRDFADDPAYPRGSDLRTGTRLVLDHRFATRAARAGAPGRLARRPTRGCS